ncbi:MAG: diguanylate cyclase [Desulfovibrionaceae bacterium]|nr:diguanylate cyclase [Desulfovibrionaceae bacterium]
MSVTMKNVKMSLKSKILIPAIVILIISLLVVSINEYGLLYRVVKNKIDSELSVFNDNLMIQLHQSEMIIAVAEKTLRAQHLASARAILHIINLSGNVDLTCEGLRNLCSRFGLVEINIVDSDGIVTHSNFDEYIGFDYKRHDETRKYMKLTDGAITELQEEPRLSVSDARLKIFCHYTGLAREKGGFIQVGYETDTIAQLRAAINIGQIVKGSKVGETGYGIVLIDGVIAAHPDEDMLGRNLAHESWFESIKTGKGVAWKNIDGEKYYVSYHNMPGHTILGLLPETEYYQALRKSLSYTVLFIAIFLVVMYITLSYIINKMLKSVKNMMESLEEIANGNFDTRIEGTYTTNEAILVQNSINDMAASIVSHINDKIHAERMIHEAELEKRNLLVKAHYDALTSIYNRRYLDENLDRIIRTHSRSGASLSVLMLDVDCFKMYNDTYGHAEGDECLKSVAAALNNSIKREDDFVVRYGGEEFCIILQSTEKNGAIQIAGKILENIRELYIANEGSKVSDYITISIGITAGPVLRNQSGDEYIKRADEALYVSKQNGRDRFTFLPMIVLESI